MNIPALGRLKPDDQFPEWLVSPPIAVPYFDGYEVAFTLDTMGEDDAGAVAEAVGAFLALGPEDRLAAGPHVFRNYERMLDAVGAEELECEIHSIEEVWNHVHPTGIFVSKRESGDDFIYLQIGAACDWEVEHGLQIIYRGGNTLSRVSDQDGHLTYADAYDLPEDQDMIDG